MSNAISSQLARPSLVEQVGRDLVVRSADGQSVWQIPDYFSTLPGDAQAAKLAGLHFPVALRRYPAVDGELWAMGSAGDDVMIAGDFDLNVAAGDGDDVIIAGAGDDYLGGDAGRDWIIAGPGNDRLYGETGDDRLYGGPGDDLLVGGSGDDRLTGGPDNDLLKGGTGNDVYLFQRGDGQDRILNEAGDSGRDIMQFGGGITSDQLWFRKMGEDLQVSLIGTDDSATFIRWYARDAERVDRFELAAGNGGSGHVRHLEQGRVDALVEAMSVFSPPSAGSTSLPEDVRASLNPVLAANWQ